MVHRIAGGVFAPPYHSRNEYQPAHA